MRADRLRPDVKYRVAVEEDGFSDESKPLKHRCKVERFYKKVQERREVEVTLLRSSERSKALKSEAHERWELKEVSKGHGASFCVDRVAKPWT